VEPTRANEPVPPPTEAVPPVGSDPTEAVPPVGGPATQPSYQVPPPVGPPPDDPGDRYPGGPPPDDRGGPPRWLLPALLAAVALLAIIVLAIWLAKKDDGKATTAATTTSTTSTTSTSTTTTAPVTTTTRATTTTAAPTTTAPPTTANPNPTVGTFARNGGNTVHCTTPADTQTVTLSWTSTGGTEAWVAVGNVADPRSAPYNSDPLAPNGSLSNIPFACSNAQQDYTVGIYNAAGRATRTITLTRAIP
jgi:hypothetical protein